jgi:hypothetical protein
MQNFKYQLEDFFKEEKDEAKLIATL